MVPYGDAVGTRKVFRIFDLLTSGKEAPRNFSHFDSKIIENGQVGVEL